MSRDRDGTVAAHPTMRYFTTFARYGVHLHGDESGSVDRNRNVPGSGRWLRKDDGVRESILYVVTWFRDRVNRWKFTWKICF